MPTTVESGGTFKEEIGSVKKSTICEFSEASSSSSIGKNSDLSENSGGEEEVQSSCDKKGALDAMEALEEVLPIRRGISSFYNGKSKSYTSLAYAAASSSSTRDIAKQDNAYTRKRRNQLSRTLNMNRVLSGLSKRSKTTLDLGDKRDGESIDSGGSSSSSLSSADCSMWRAFSTADLQRYGKACSGLDSNP